MRLFTTLLTLLLSSGGAWAQWFKVAETSDVVFYIDIETVQKEGDRRRVWTIQDLKEMYSDGELSMRAREEFDCKEDRSRLLSLTTHSGPMATGTTLWKTSDPREWNDIPPDTPARIILKIICSN
ncbi:MAG: surface-adhesin E family protein [Hylemonella sp.]